MHSVGRVLDDPSQCLVMGALMGAQCKQGSRWGFDAMSVAIWKHLQPLPCPSCAVTWQEGPQVAVGDSRQLWLAIGALMSLTMQAGQQLGLSYDVCCNRAALAAITRSLCTATWQEGPQVGSW